MYLNRPYKIQSCIWMKNLTEYQLYIYHRFVDSQNFFATYPNTFSQRSTYYRIRYRSTNYQSHQSYLFIKKISHFEQILHQRIFYIIWLSLYNIYRQRGVKKYMVIRLKLHLCQCRCLFTLNED